MDAARSGEPVSLIGIRLHILVNGDLFDAETREARPGDCRRLSDPPSGSRAVTLGRGSGRSP